MVWLGPVDLRIARLSRGSVQNEWWETTSQSVHGDWIVLTSHWLSQSWAGGRLSYSPFRTHILFHAPFVHLARTIVQIRVQMTIDITTSMASSPVSTHDPSSSSLSSPWRKSATSGDLPDEPGEQFSKIVLKCFFSNAETDENPLDAWYALALEKERTQSSTGSQEKKEPSEPHKQGSNPLEKHGSNMKRKSSTTSGIYSTATTLVGPKAKQSRLMKKIQGLRK